MITGVVKGNRQQVAAALSDHQMPSSVVLAYNRRYNECIIQAPDYFKSHIGAWFNEGIYHKAPYPVGTLLFWNTDRRYK